MQTCAAAMYASRWVRIKFQFLTGFEILVAETHTRMTYNAHMHTIITSKFTIEQCPGRRVEWNGKRMTTMEIILKKSNIFSAWAVSYLPFLLLLWRIARGVCFKRQSHARTTWRHFTTSHVTERPNTICTMMGIFDFWINDNINWPQQQQQSKAVRSNGWVQSLNRMWINI